MARVGAGGGRRRRGGASDARRDVAAGTVARTSRGSRVRPELVCEVAFDHLQGDRFRHAATFRRWRPDRSARPTAATTSSRRRRPRCWRTCSAAEAAGYTLRRARATVRRRETDPCPSPSIPTLPSTTSPTDSGRASSSATRSDATILGDERYNDRWPDLGAERSAADEAAFLRATLAEAQEIPAEGLEPEQVITRDLLVLVAENHLEALAQKQYQLGIDHMSGPQIWPAEVAQYQAADTPERLDQLLARYAAYPAMIEQYVSTLAEGVADGRTAAAVPVRRAIEQIERLLAMPPADHPATSMARVADADRPRVVASRWSSTSTPACAGCATTSSTSTSRTRAPSPALSTTPGGDDAYRLAIRSQTSIEATAEEVHAFGMADLEAIEAEKDEIARRLGLADRHALRRALADDAANHTDDPSAHRRARPGADRPGLRGGAEVLRAAAERQLLRQGRSRRTARRTRRRPSTCRPRSTVRDRGSTTSTPTSRPTGSSTSSPPSRSTRPRRGITSRSRIEMELEGLPAFRRLGARMAGVAYAEGWGLYTERLADEMGLYADERERFGMLEAQSFRAARLVVDSGLHAMGWSRQQAIDFMHERGDVPMVDAEIEVDRYTVWPGQALAYKLGQREIERARADVTEAMGDRFDLRAFHDEVLGHGSLPLATLRREILGWVEAAVAG